FHRTLHAIVIKDRAEGIGLLIAEHALHLALLSIVAANEVEGDVGQFVQVRRREGFHRHATGQHRLRRLLALLREAWRELALAGLALGRWHILFFLVLIFVFRLILIGLVVAVFLILVASGGALLGALNKCEGVIAEGIGHFHERVLRPLQEGQGVQRRIIRRDGHCGGSHAFSFGVVIVIAHTSLPGGGFQFLAGFRFEIRGNLRLIEAS